MITRVQVRAREVPLDPPITTARATMHTVPVVTLAIEAADGADGHAYARTFTPVALPALTALLESIAPLLRGHSSEPGAVASTLGQRFALLGTTGLVGAALATIDVALWNLKAQRAGQPLAQLLGATRTEVAAYATLRTTTAREAVQALERGFTTVKVKLGPDTDDARIVDAIRATGARVMVDYNQSLTVEQAIARARGLEPFDLVWVEEPTDGHDLEAHARIQAATSIPIQLGESLERHELTRAIAPRLMLNALRTGGVSGWMQVARTTQARLSSHAYPELSVHLLAASPTGEWLEWVDHGIAPPPPINRGCAAINNLSTQ